MVDSALFIIYQYRRNHFLHIRNFTAGRNDDSSRTDDLFTVRIFLSHRQRIFSGRYIDFSFDKLRLGGSAFAQSLNKVGDDVPTVQNPEYFRDAFLAVQELVNKGLIMAGHDISAGGLITTLLEMCFSNMEGGMEISLNKIKEDDIIKILFAENPGIVITGSQTTRI